MAKKKLNAGKFWTENLIFEIFESGEKNNSAQTLMDRNQRKQGTLPNSQRASPILDSDPEIATTEDYGK